MCQYVPAWYRVIFVPAKKLIDPAEIGSKGGKARARNLTKEELSKQGRRAVEERWRRYREAQATAKEPKKPGKNVKP